MSKQDPCLAIIVLSINSHEDDRVEEWVIIARSVRIESNRTESERKDISVLIV